MEIKLKPYESLAGIKIFDGIDEKTNLPYCQPNYNVKQIYQIGENKYNGKIQLCENGFHFSLDISAAGDYKSLFSDHIDKKYPNALMIKPVYYVTAKDKILSEEYEKFGCFRHKYVTNNLTIGRQFYVNEIMFHVLNYIVFGFTYSSLDKPVLSTHEIDFSTTNQPYYFNRCLIQTFAKDVTIDRIPDYHNHTIISRVDSLLTVRNKTKYTQYVNRYGYTEQYITPVPRYSTVEFKRLDKFGKVIKK